MGSFSMGSRWEDSSIGGSTLAALNKPSWFKERVRATRTTFFIPKYIYVGQQRAYLVFAIKYKVCETYILRVSFQGIKFKMFKYNLYTLKRFKQFNST